MIQIFVIFVLQFFFSFKQNKFLIRSNSKKSMKATNNFWVQKSLQSMYSFKNTGCPIAFRTGSSFIILFKNKWDPLKLDRLICWFKKRLLYYWYVRLIEEKLLIKIPRLNSFDNFIYILLHYKSPTLKNKHFLEHFLPSNL